MTKRGMLPKQPKPMTLEQAAMQLAHFMMDDPGATLVGYLHEDYANEIAKAMTVITGTHWIVLGQEGNYKVRTFENVDAKAMLEAKMK